MKFDVTIFPDKLNDAITIGRQVEDYGFDGLWTAEAQHNPYLPLTLAASSTQRINLGTQIALAFPRSPMVTAQLAWDLAAQSEGRFLLGLGTQIKIHIIKRFSSLWIDKPVTQLREYVESIHAIWRAFQEGSSLRYRGDTYSFGFLPPFFSPGAITHPNIPIYIAGVGAPLCTLAGELADGFHVHPFHTTKYLREVIHPAIAAGAHAKNRDINAIQTSCAIFVVTGTTPDEIAQNTIDIKTQIGFYASTPSYHRVLELHGWKDFGDRMNAMSKQNLWQEMWKEVPDEILHEIAVVAPPEELPYRVQERYAGLLDRVGYYFPFKPEDAGRKVVWDYASKAIQEGIYA